MSTIGSNNMASVENTIALAKVGMAADNRSGLSLEEMHALENAVIEKVKSGDLKVDEAIFVAQYLRDAQSQADAVEAQRTAQALAASEQLEEQKDKHGPHSEAKTPGQALEDVAIAAIASLTEVSAALNRIDAMRSAGSMSPADAERLSTAVRERANELVKAGEAEKAAVEQMWSSFQDRAGETTANFLTAEGSGPTTGLTAADLANADRFQVGGVKGIKG